MKFYVSSRVKDVDRVHEIRSVLEEAGHEISYDWTQGLLPKPFIDNQATVATHAAECIDGILEADVFIMVSDSTGKAMYTEMGIAMQSHSDTGKPRIYVLGEHNDLSIFFFHPSVIRADTVKDVLTDLE